MTRRIDPHGKTLPLPGWIEAGQPEPDKCSWCDGPLTRYRGLPLCIHCDLVPRRAIHPATKETE